MALYLGFVPRQLWNVPCGAHRTNGEPCSAWAMRGQYTCWAHGGASPQARAWAEARLWRDRFWVRAAREISCGLREYDARLRADPEAVHTETRVKDHRHESDWRGAWLQHLPGDPTARITRRPASAPRAPGLRTDKFRPGPAADMGGLAGQRMSGC